MGPEKLMLNFIWESKEQRIAKTILKSKVGDFVLPDIKYNDH